MAVAELPITLRCPLCLERFVARTAEGPLVRCSGCQTITHQACRHELGPCPVLGCSSSARPAAPQPAPAPSPALLRWRTERSHHSAEFAALTAVVRRHPWRFGVAALLGVAYLLFWPQPEPPDTNCYLSYQYTQEVRERLSRLKAK